MPSDAHRIVDSLYDAYNQHDADAAAALYAPDGRHLEVAQGGLSEGRGAIRDGLVRFFGAFPDARWEERERVVSDGGAAVTYQLTGTLRGPLGPFDPDEQRLELQGAHVLRIAGNLIESSEDYWDAATFARQMSLR